MTTRKHIWASRLLKISANSQEVIWRPFAHMNLVLARSRIKLQATRIILHNLTKYISWIHLSPWLPPRYHSDSSNWAQKRPWQHSFHDSNYSPAQSGRVTYIHHQLMCSWYQLEVVRVVKLFRDVLTKRITSTARRNTPAASIIGVGPKEITDGSDENYFGLLTLHEEPLGLDRGRGFNQECQCWGTDHREDRRLSFQQRRWVECNRRTRWRTSRRWRCRTFGDIRRRIRTCSKES